MSRSRRPGNTKKNGSGSGSGANAGNGTQAAKPGDPLEFWGAPAVAVTPIERMRPAADATPVVRSLGPPPLAGHDAIAESYFTLVYDKATNMATALAAASGLLDQGD